MKNRTFKAMVIGLAAVTTLTCMTPAAVFAAAPNNDDGWVDVVDDDDFYAEDENGEFHSREYFDDYEDDFDDNYDAYDDDDDFYDDEDFDDDYDDDDDFVEISPEEETGRDIVNNSHAGYSYANCRENPGLDAEILFTIPNGTRVYPTGNVVYKNGFDWYEIHLAGSYDYGWIAGHLIGR